jgi:cobalt/nickel transport protein
MKRIYWYVLGFGVIIVICMSAFIFSPNGEFGGADGQGSDQIQTINPNFEPWFDNLWYPPAETEAMLFAIQAAIGAVIIGYFIGNEHGKRTARGKTRAEKAPGHEAQGEPIGK